MRDISAKYPTLRTARASCRVEVEGDIQSIFDSGRTEKGDIFECSKTAGLLAAKNTARLLPFCHPIALDHVAITFQVQERTITITADVKAIDRTGVEMEALTAVSVTALNIYDMFKPYGADITISDIKLEGKTGGKSQHARKVRDLAGLKVAVVVISDSVAAGEKKDSSGLTMSKKLEEWGLEVFRYEITSDDKDEIRERLLTLIYTDEISIIFTTGGTGPGPRDNTVAITASLIEKSLPGFGEAMRRYGAERIPNAILSAGIAGIAKNKLIINLPGSRNAVIESLDALYPAFLHTIKMMRGEGH